MGPALEFSARGLINKRARAAGRLLPATWRLLGEEARTHFALYAACSPCPAGQHKHRLDAVEFSRWLVRCRGSAHQVRSAAAAEGELLAVRAGLRSLLILQMDAALSSALYGAAAKRHWLIALRAGRGSVRIYRLFRR